MVTWGSLVSERSRLIWTRIGVLAGGGSVAGAHRARVSGKAAVCLATSGPGATNLITALADARLDSIPLVAITAQVPQALIGTDAFQEVDTYGLTLPVTKHNFLIRSVAELLEVVPLAFELAMDEGGEDFVMAVDIAERKFDTSQDMARLFVCDLVGQLDEFSVLDSFTHNGARSSGQKMEAPKILTFPSS